MAPYYTRPGLALVWLTAGSHSRLLDSRVVFGACMGLGGTRFRCLPVGSGKRAPGVAASRSTANPRRSAVDPRRLAVRATVHTRHRGVWERRWGKGPHQKKIGKRFLRAFMGCNPGLHQKQVWGHHLQRRPRNLVHSQRRPRPSPAAMSRRAATDFM